MKQGLSTAVVGFAVLSTLTAAGAAACVQIAARDIPIGQIVFFRGLCALPILLLCTRLDGPLRVSLAVNSPMKHLQRALIGCAGLTCFYASISLLPLSLAVAVSYLVPTFVAVTEVSNSKWASGFSLIATALVGLGGVVLILGQHMTVDTIDARIGAGLACGVLGAVLTSAALIRVRALTKTDAPGAIAFYFSLACTILGLMTLSLGWSEFGTTVAVALTGCGLLSAISHVTLTQALARAGAAKVAPFDYLILVWTLGYQIFVSGRSPTMAEIAGVAGVILAMQLPRALQRARSE